jgi:N-acetylglucosamine-6-phosphate deacetylase
MLITNARIYQADGVFRAGWLRVEGSAIAEMGEGALPADSMVVDAGGQRIVPGFMNVHIHGFMGWDVNAPDPDHTRRLGEVLAQHGVTAWLPTVAAEGHEETLAALRAVRQAIAEPGTGAEAVGIHLEGPFLNPLRRGAFTPQSLREPNLAELQEYIEAAGGLIRRLTLAPELPGALELVRYCRAHQIVPVMGHSDATYEQALAGVAAGIGGVTHCYNAMRPIHHREPGNIAATFTLRIPAEMITDGVHVHPAAVRMAHLCLGPTAMMIITDSVAMAGLPDGEYPVYGDVYILKDGQVHNREGSLAGSSLAMNVGLRNATQFLGLPLEQVLPMATTTPLVGSGAEGRKGVLAPGRDADLVLLDEDLNVLRTMVRGRWVFERADRGPQL